MAERGMTLAHRTGVEERQPMHSDSRPAAQSRSRRAGPGCADGCTGGPTGSVGHGQLLCCAGARSWLPVGAHRGSPAILGIAHPVGPVESTANASPWASAAGLICHWGYEPHQCRPRSEPGGPCLLAPDCASRLCQIPDTVAPYEFGPNRCAKADPSCDIRLDAACGYLLSCGQCVTGMD
jgi:hypothetical protein